MGRVQPLLPQLLHESVGEAEQPVSSVPAGVVCAASWQIVSLCLQIVLVWSEEFSCNLLWLGRTVRFASIIRFLMIKQLCVFMCV